MIEVVVVDVDIVVTVLLLVEVVLSMIALVLFVASSSDGVAAVVSYAAIVY